MMDAQERDTRYLSGTVLKAAEILKLISEHTMTASEIGRVLGMEKTTIHRLLDTLEYAGFVDRGTDRRKYEIGRTLAEMCGRSEEQFWIRIVGERAVRALTTSLQQEISLSVLYFGMVLYLLSSIFRNGAFEITDRTLASPLHCSACGKALLTGRQDEEIRRILTRNGMAKYTLYTQTTPDAFLEELLQVNRYGYALGIQEYRVHFQWIAVPVFGEDGTVIASLSARIKDKAQYGELSPAVQNTLIVLQAEASKLAAQIDWISQKRRNR